MLLLFEFVFYIVYFLLAEGYIQYNNLPFKQRKIQYIFKYGFKWKYKKYCKKNKKAVLSDDFIYFETERKIEMSLNKDTETVAEILSGLPKKYINGIFIEYNK